MRDQPLASSISTVLLVLHPNVRTGRHPFLAAGDSFRSTAAFRVSLLAVLFYFLLLSSWAELPFAFAAPAGTGDIIVAGLAVLLFVLSDARRWNILIIWNTIGLTDILFVVMLALRLGLEDPQSMHALREFPLSLLPTFLVPLILVSHILIFVRAAIAMRHEKHLTN